MRALLLLLLACPTNRDKEGADTACDAPTDWYADEDADGWGGALVASACAAPAGAVDASGDCDEADPAVNPGAEEVCADGVDNDCAPGAPSCPRLAGELDDADADLRLVGDWNTMGYWLSAADYDGDGADELVTSDAYAGEDYQGAVYVLGGALGEVVAAAEHLAMITGEDPDGRVGNSATALADLTGDGTPDLAFLDREERAWLFAGPVRGELIHTEADVALRGVNQTDERASQIAAGDLDGDGAADLLLGAQRDFGGTDPGAVWLVRGPLGAGELELESGATATLAGVDANDRLGWSVVAGDADGDGVDDLWTAAVRDSETADKAGRIYLFLGPLSGALSLGDAALSLGGGWTQAGLGHQLAADGDVDGDGHADLLASASGAHPDGVGALYLFAGPQVGITGTEDAAATVYGDLPENTGFACHADFAGDPNADGLTDLIASDCDSSAGASRGGAFWLHYGPLSGTLGLSSAELVVRGTTENHSLGKDVGGVGDLDQDGFDDVAAGSFFGPQVFVFRGGVTL